jgi:hypothetical protein
MAKERNRRIVTAHGPPCPRCRQPMEVREHERITEKELHRPFYYSRWFNCTNRQCKTTLVMPEFRVFNEKDAGPGQRAARGHAELDRDVRVTTGELFTGAVDCDAPPWE